jgi:hypothetical protein
MLSRRWVLYCGAIAMISLQSVNLSAQASPQKPAPQSQPSGRTGDASKSVSLPDQRAEWFHQQRAFPRTSIPTGVREKAVTHARRMASAQRAVSASGASVSGALAAVSPQWTPIGPKPIVTNAYAGNSASGRVTALVVDPSNPDVVYMGAAQGGVWKTTQGSTPNALWTPLTDTLPSLAMGALALDPTTCTAIDCSIIYAGTGEEDFSGDSYFGAGIFKSTDAGQTWTKLPGTITNVAGIGSFTGPFNSGVGGARFSSLVVDPSNTQHLLAAVQILNVNGGASSGIYRSTDGGNTWAIVQGGGAGIDISADPGHAGTFYATLGTPGGSAGNGVYQSTDDGVTWTAINGAAGSSIPAGASAGRIALGFAPASGGVGTLYAGIQDPTPGPNLNNLLGFFKSTDGGAHWTNLPNTPKYCNPQCWYDNVVRTQPSDASGNTVYVGGSADSGGSFATLYRSTDGGNSWTNVSADASGFPLIHTDMHALAFAADSSLLYAGNDGGVWVTGDLPTSGTAIPNWTNLNATLQITQFYPSMSIHPSNPRIGLGGTQDNNTLLYSNASWTGVTCGDGGWTIIDPVIPSTAYSACTRSTLLKSDQSGALGSFGLANSGIDPTDPVSFIAPFVIDPINNQQLYFGTNRLWETTDGANSWTAASGALTTTITGFLTAIAAAPASQSQRIVYAGTVGGLLWVSLPFASGQPALSQLTSSVLPSRAVTQIVIDPSDPMGRTAYVTYSGFSGIYPGFAGGDTVGHIFKTTTAGGFWNDVSCQASDCSAPGATDLPNTPANDLVIDPDDPTHNTIYAATDVGVFQTSDGGATWSHLNNGLPNVAVLSLRLHDPSRTLRAATHGRGAWDLALPALAGTASFRISSISPPTTGTSTNSIVVTVDGAGFTSASQVQWNGGTSGIVTDASGAPISLNATIPGALLGSAGTASITVTDPGQATPTNALLFTITGSAPTLTQIQPSSAQGGPSAVDVHMTLTGSGFNATSMAEFDGQSAGVTTTFQSATSSLTAVISHTLLAYGGVHEVTVVNPPPAGGPSNAQPFTVSAPGPPANDNFASATAITSTNFSNTVDNSAATTESTDPTPPCVANSTNPRTKTVWYVYTAGGSGAVTLDTVGSSYDTTLSVWTVSGGAGSSLQFTNVACNDDIVGGVVTQSRLTFAASLGTTYYVMIAPFGPPEGADQAGGKTVINVTTSVPPSALSAAPILATVTAGSPANISVTNTSQPGANATFTLTCSGLPRGAACMQASVAPGASATLTISTTSRAVLPPSNRTPAPLPTVPRGVAISAAVVAIALVSLFAARPRRRVLLSLPLAIAVIVILLSTAGCNNTGSGGGGGGGGNGTPAGVYPIVVTGTSGSTTQATTVILQVN